MSSQNQHSDIMLRISRRHEELLDLIGDGPVQYLDIPVHGNIGDLLIYHGTLAFLKRNKIKIGNTSSKDTYTPSKDKSVILFHGGGNLGDLWPQHQIFREQVISQNITTRIVILPQSVHFRSQTALARARRTMHAHPDLHLFVRDHSSLEIAKRLCKNVRLMPDMAHQLYPVIPTSCPTKRTLIIKRSDKESHLEHQDLAIDGVSTCTDWNQLDTLARQRFTRYLDILHTHSKKIGAERISSAAIARLWATISKHMIKRAIRLFSEHDRVVTDRLHAHILSSLMHIPNTVYDNSYGKNSGYINAWTADSPLLTEPRPAFSSYRTDDRK